MDACDVTKTYYAVDTFSGFVAEDIQHEVLNRSKKADLYTGFRGNNKNWFDVTMRQNDIARVHSIETDVNKYDLTTLGPLSFVLLDVDLYRPIKKALPELYRVLSPNGIIVIDDCDPANVRWDGANHAYNEFLVEIGKSPHIVFGKLGVIKKDA